MKKAIIWIGALVLVSCQGSIEAEQKKLRLSLAEWSLHETIFSGQITHLDFPRVAKEEFGIETIELVNQFFLDKVEDSLYLDRFVDSCMKYGVQSLLLMVDLEGDLGSTEEILRSKAVEDHQKWIRAAAYLGCQAIRVNAYGSGAPNDVQAAMVLSMRELASYASRYNVAILLENHGGYSSDWNWLMNVVMEANCANCGLLPDFGNFDSYDPYKGMDKMMPLAWSVSAKAWSFDEDGEEPDIDYEKMFKILEEHQYAGYIGIELDSQDPSVSEMESIQKAKALIAKYAY